MKYLVSLCVAVNAMYLKTAYQFLGQCFTLVELPAPSDLCSSGRRARDPNALHYSIFSAPNSAL